MVANIPKGVSIAQLKEFQQQASLRESLQSRRSVVGGSFPRQTSLQIAKRRSSFKGVSARTSGGYAGSINVRARPPGIPQPNIGSSSPGAGNIAAKTVVQKLPLRITPKGVGIGALTIFATELAIHNLKLAYKLYKLSQKEPHFQIADSEPSLIGQEGVEYFYEYHRVQIYQDPAFRSEEEAIIKGENFKAIGKIGGIRAFVPEGGGYKIEIYCQRTPYSQIIGQPYGYDWHPNGEIASAPYQALVDSFKILGRVDGLPESVASPTADSLKRIKVNGTVPTTVPGTRLIPDDVGWGRFLKAQPGESLEPNEQNKRKPVAVQIPSNTPIRFSFDSSVRITPFTIISDQPSQISVAPSRINPATNAVETPIKVSSPSSVSASSPSLIQQPATLVAPGNGPVTITIPGQQPITINPDGTAKPTGLTSSQSEPRAFVPTPATTPTPKQTPATPKAPQIPNFRDKDLQEIGLTLVGITALLKGIQPNVSPEALENAAAAGTCRTTQAGGCTSNAINNAVQKGNKDLLDKLNAGGQAADLLLLNTINNKLGAQVPGGISGFLGRFAKSIHLDKIINALTLIAALHNAAMLSRSLGSTLGDLTGQALSVIGLKDEEGDTIDVNKILNQEVDKLFVSILGEAVWKGVKTTWNKLNTVISSASQIVWTVRSLFDSGREVLEWTAENTGKIGNALKRFRIVGENAYRWMPERVTATNVWTEKVNRAREGIDSLDDAASSLSSVLGEVQNIQEEYKELNEQKQRFDKNLKEFTPKQREDNEPVKAAVEASRAASKAPASAADVFRGEGENA